METLKFTSKEQRDKVFRDLRENGDKLEKKAIRYSDVELVGDIQISKDGGKFKPVYQDIWLISYPRI